MTDRIDAAKAYAARGWVPVQLHGIAADGLCTCMDRKKPGHERTAGKHPRDKAWQSAEPMTDAELEKAFGGAIAYNVGIRTGQPSGFFVLDIDPDSGGTESITRLQAEHAPIETTCATVTGSGGWHLIFEMPPDFEPTNRRGGLKEYPGLDIRGTGGQIVAPPSVSAKGAYRWLKEGAPQQAPAWLLDLLRPEGPKAPAPAPPVTTPAPTGDAETERLEKYAQTVRDLEVGRLTAMKDAAVPDGQQYAGDPWNETTFHVACSLLELANSTWASYDVERAYVDLHVNAPRDIGFTDEDVNKCFQSAVSRVGSTGRPYPAARQDNASEVASWLSEPGVRVDPLLLKGKPPPPGVTVAEDPPPDDKPMRTWDDLGNAMRVVDHYGKGLRWVAEAEQWAVFRKGRWQLVKPNIVQGLIQRMFDELVPRTEALGYSEIPEGDDGEESSPREKFLKWLKAQRMSARIGAAQKEAQGRWELQANMADFDAQPLLLNVANGVVDLTTGELRPADPKLMLMRQSPVAYDPTAAAPLWEKFLDRVMPEEDMKQYLQRILGYSLTGDTREQAFFIWHGDGANGKSVASGVVGRILGEYGQVVAPSTLLANTQDEHPTGVAMMQGKRWLPATETAPGRRLDEEKVKNLTGGEPVAARFMGKDFFEFIPSGKIHLITNHLPFLSDAKSIWRRIHLIRWAVSIPDAEVDRMLEFKLRDELPGILAWLVRGALGWQEQGLNAPPAAIADVEAYRGSSDSFGDFLRERTLPASEDTKTPTVALYRAYTSWCFDQGIRKPMTQQSFVATMVERKFEHYRDARSRGFVGIAAVQPVAAELPWET